MRPQPRGYEPRCGGIRHRRGMAMSLMNKTNAGDRPSHEAIEDHDKEGKTQPRDKEAMESATKANQTIKKAEEGKGGIFTP